MSATIMGIWGTLTLITTIWVLYDTWAVNKTLGTGAKILWTIVALCFGIIGAAAYYFLAKSNRSIQEEEKWV